jgi:hypothetical protein
MLMSTLSLDDQELIDAIKIRVSDQTHATTMAQLADYPATIYPPPSPALIDQAVAELGFSLPNLIREIFLQIGNGGFGPGYGILGLSGGCLLHGYTLVELTLFNRRLIEQFDAYGLEESDLDHWQWGDHYLLYAYWGCNTTTVVDCALPALPVYALDALSIAPHPSGTLRHWWRDWLAGTIRQE